MAKSLVLTILVEDALQRNRDARALPTTSPEMVKVLASQELAIRALLQESDQAQATIDHLLIPYKK